MYMHMYMYMHMHKHSTMQYTTRIIQHMYMYTSNNYKRTCTCMHVL